MTHKVTRHQHPHEHITELLMQDTAFFLTKRSWNGFSNPKGTWLFVVLNIGPEWVQLKAIYNSSRPLTENETQGRAFWITWEAFGAFGIDIEEEDQDG